MRVVVQIILFVAVSLMTKGIVALPMSKQLIIVVENSHVLSQGHLWLLTQDDKQHWQLQLDTPVVVGKQGMTRRHREGDGATPMGVFPITTAFGFSKQPLNARLRYRYIRRDTACVDDSNSRFYTDIVDAHDVAVDWHSSEQMHDIPLYRYGLVISYNTQRYHGHGSCLFIHSWSNAHHGTAGCIAMPMTRLKDLIRYLDPTKHPKLISI